MTARPPYWTAALTLFSKSVDANGRVSWARQYIPGGCFWRRTLQRNRSSGTVAEVYSVTARIPTPAPGAKTGDIIVLGPVSWAIDEYTAGLRSADFLAAHPDTATTVSRVRRNDAAGVPFPHLCLEG